MKQLEVEQEQVERLAAIKSNLSGAPQRVGTACSTRATVQIAWCEDYCSPSQKLIHHKISRMMHAGSPNTLNFVKRSSGAPSFRDKVNCSSRSKNSGTAGSDRGHSSRHIDLCIIFIVNLPHASCTPYIHPTPIALIRHLHSINYFLCTYLCTYECRRKIATSRDSYIHNSYHLCWVDRCVLTM